MENEQLQVTEQLLVEQKSFYKLWYIDMKSVRKRDVYFNLLYKRGVMHKVWLNNTFMLTDSVFEMCKD